MIAQQPTRIGFPRACLYHKYAPMWTHFFRSLGCQIVTSPPTNRTILAHGTRCSIDENCLAVKIYLGHVHYLVGKVDYIFIPHIVCLYPTETVCVKLLALGDIVRNTFTEANILEYTVDVEHRQYEWMGMLQVGLKLTRNPLKVVQAYREAVGALKAHKLEQLEKQERTLQAPADSDCRVLLVAHPYITHDALLGKTVARFLGELDVDVLYADVADEQVTRRLSPQLSTDLFWSYSKELVGAIEHYRSAVDGIIFLMAFPCGPDALVINLCQNTITDVPVCVLVLDELQGDAGLKTRLESFIDILRLKKENTP